MNTEVALFTEDISKFSRNRWVAMTNLQDGIQKIGEFFLLVFGEPPPAFQNVALLRRDLRRKTVALKEKLRERYAERRANALQRRNRGNQLFPVPRRNGGLREFRALGKFVFSPPPFKAHFGYFFEYIHSNSYDYALFILQIFVDF